MRAPDESEGGVPAERPEPSAIESRLVATLELLQHYGAQAGYHERFVIGEAGPARYAFLRCIAALGERPLLTHLMYLRLVTEVVIRLAWIHRRRTGGRQGVAGAIDALTKRDLMHLRKANRALNQDTPDASAQIDRMLVKEAPPTLEQLARDVPHASHAYARHGGESLGPQLLNESFAHGEMVHVTQGPRVSTQLRAIQRSLSAPPAGFQAPIFMPVQ